MILWIILIIILICFFIFSTELYKFMFWRKSSKLFEIIFNAKGHEKNFYITRDNAAERLHNTAHEIFEINSERGEKLKGFYYNFNKDSNKIAFIIHGYRSNHEDAGGMYFEFYRDHGINVFCPDHTASGESEGEYIGFDVFETKDCLAWIDFLKEKFGNNIEIILHGFSMGGATVLKMSSYCPENVKFIIADSAYKNAKASLDHQVGIMYEPMRFVNRIIAGYDIKYSDVVESLSKSNKPILFVHGRDDKLVPFVNGQELYSLYQGEKDYFFPEKTRHIESMYTSHDEYCEKIEKFIDKYLKDENKIK